MTELLELPYEQGERVSSKDVLAETILVLFPRSKRPSSRSRTASVKRADDPQFRARLEEALATYTGTRAAAAEMTTTLIALGAGALTVSRPPLARLRSVRCWPRSWLNKQLSHRFRSGQRWAGSGSPVPRRGLPGPDAGITGGLVGLGAVASAFSGVIADPIQRRLGLHRRRLLRLIGALEAQFFSDEAAGLVVRDHYVARLPILFELLAGAYRVAKPG